MKDKDISKAELIGLEAEVIDAKNRSNIGIKGKIIDETKNTVIIQEKETKKQLMKSQITLKIKLNQEFTKIQGDLLIGKPKDRIKK